MSHQDIFVPEKLELLLLQRCEKDFLSKHPPTIKSCQRPSAVAVCRHTEDEGGREGRLVGVFGDNHHRVVFILADHFLTRQDRGPVIIDVLHHDDDRSRARLHAFSKATSTLTPLYQESVSNMLHLLHEYNISKAKT